MEERGFNWGGREAGGQGRPHRRGGTEVKTSGR